VISVADATTTTASVTVGRPAVTDTGPYTVTVKGTAQTLDAAGNPTGAQMPLAQIDQRLINRDKFSLNGRRGTYAPPATRRSAPHRPPSSTDGQVPAKRPPFPRSRPASRARAMARPQPRCRNRVDDLREQEDVIAGPAAAPSPRKRITCGTTAERGYDLARASGRGSRFETTSICRCRMHAARN